MSVLPIAMQSCEHVLEIPLNDGSGRVMCVGVPVQWRSGLDDDGKRVVIEKFRASFLEQGASDVVRIGLCDCYTAGLPEAPDDKKDDNAKAEGSKKDDKPKTEGKKKDDKPKTRGDKKDD